MDGTAHDLDRSDGEWAADRLFAWQFRADIAAVALGVALTVWLVRSHRWGEATYVGGQVAALATSSYYLSVGRATLLWWPLWVGVARLAARRPAAYTVYLAVATPLMVIGVAGFTTGRWCGLRAAVR